MRQVDGPELVHLIQNGLRQVPVSILKDMLHYDADKRLKARLIAAEQVAEGMKRLEIMTSAPAGPQFRYAALGDESGPVL